MVRVVKRGGRISVFVVNCCRSAIDLFPHDPLLRLRSWNPVRMRSVMRERGTGPLLQRKQENCFRLRGSTSSMGSAVGWMCCAFPKSFAKPACVMKRSSKWCK